MQIKHSSWFAAGPEVKAAMAILSDGAFKVYMFICLNARRDVGTLVISYANIARELGKSRRSINTHFDELRDRDVCCVDPAQNQHETTTIEIKDKFWPYARSSENGPILEESAYVRKMKSLLIARACVKCSFTGPDQKLASMYFRRGISIAQAERAIVLGCCRKYVSWLNGAHVEPIVSLSYFADLVEEACDEEAPESYWDYLFPRLKKLESLWLERSVPTSKPS